MSKRGRTGSAVLTAIALCTAMLWPSRVYAEQPESTAATFIAPHYCLDVEVLAGATNGEAGAQQRIVQIKVMQVFVKESEKRGITVCALMNLTNFSTVPAFARKYPLSYQASRYNSPPPELLDMAGQVLRHELADETGGMTNFDGSADGMRIVFSY